MSALPDPGRPRDFSITQPQADRLRGSALSRLMRRLGASASLWGTVRPVAAAALSIGLVAAMAGTALPNEAATFEDRSSTIQMPAPESNGEPFEAHEVTIPSDGGILAPRSTAEPVMPVLEQAVGEDDTSKAMNDAYLPAAGGAGPGDEGNSFDEETAAAGPASPKDLLIYTGLLAALISAALLSVAWFARRYFADPLLR